MIIVLLISQWYWVSSFFTFINRHWYMMISARSCLGYQVIPVIPNVLAIMGGWHNLNIKRLDNYPSLVPALCFPLVPWKYLSLPMFPLLRLMHFYRLLLRHLRDAWESLEHMEGQDHMEFTSNSRLTLGFDGAVELLEDLALACMLMDMDIYFSYSNKNVDSRGEERKRWILKAHQERLLIEGFLGLKIKKCYF